MNYYQYWVAFFNNIITEPDIHILARTNTIHIKLMNRIKAGREEDQG